MLIRAAMRFYVLSTSEGSCLVVPSESMPCRSTSDMSVKCSTVTAAS
jgi:hypothetical protein